MVIEVNIYSLLIGFLCILGAVALVYLTITLVKVGKLLTNLNNFFEKNENNLDSTVTNIKDISDNLKDVSEVVTETTADAIVMKESIVENLSSISDIIAIILNVFRGR